MPRDARLVITPADPDSVADIEDVLEGGTAFDCERAAHSILVYVDAPMRPADVARQVHKCLRDSGLVDEVPEHFVVETWDEESKLYLQKGVRRFSAPTVATWIVSVEPASVWDWHEVRDELGRRQRRVLKETQRAMIVPAEDESDAEELAVALKRLRAVGRTERKKLGWFERWRYRQALLGNYGGEPDSE